MKNETHDVVVVGGGPAGLTAAIALSRLCRSVLVVDAGAPRNAASGHVHNYLGREGDAPADLLADGRAEVAGYGGEVVTGTVVAARAVQHDDTAGLVGFRVELEDGSAVGARRLLVTTGLVDELPDLPGLAQQWVPLPAVGGAVTDADRSRAPAPELATHVGAVSPIRRRDGERRSGGTVVHAAWCSRSPDC